MADISDAEIVLNAINELKKKRKRQYLNNISGLIKLHHGWSDELIQGVLDEMVSAHLLHEVRMNKKISYRIVKGDKENAGSEGSEGDYKLLYDNLSRDFIDFKEYVFNELALLRENSSNEKNLVSPSYDNNSSQLVSCLKERICSLEQQLNDKQKVIEMLISSKNASAESNFTNNKNVVVSKNPIQGDEKNFPAKTTPLPLTSTEKKKPMALIIGDSILNGIHESAIKLQNKTVSIKPYSGATSEDICDYIKPEVRKCPETLLIHVGTNDLSRNIKTVDNLKKIKDYVTSKSNNTKIIVSTITTRSDDPNLQGKAERMNSRIKKFALNNNIICVDNKNIEESCLSIKKLHLNKKGKQLLAYNFQKVLSK